MKVRQGFVSNSSSASFIVKWKFKNKNSETKDDVMLALTELFDLSYFYLENKEKGIEDDVFKEEFAKLADYATFTRYDKKSGIYTTSIWTSMLNTYFDFGDAGSLLIALADSEGRFELVETSVDRD